MARKRIQMRKIKQIAELHYKKGLTQRQIASITKTSRPAVKEYIDKISSLGIDWESIKDKSDKELLQLIAPEKKTSERKKRLFDHIEATYHLLSQKSMTRMLLWEEYCEKEPEPYGYSQYCLLLDKWIKGKKEMRCIIEHKPGAEMYVDYSGLKLPFYPVDESKPEYAEVFVTLLGFSQKTYVRALESQDSLDTQDATARALTYFGGAPVTIVPDNMKTAVTKACKYEPILNRSFEDLASHYGAVVVPARPGKSRDKALVENAVRNIQRRIIRRMRNVKCKSVDELNAVITPLLEEYNDRPFQKMPQSRNSLWESVERQTLAPLPPISYEPRIVVPSLLVSSQCHVELKCDMRRYSVPYRFCGKRIDLFYTALSVEMRYEGERIAFHKRIREPGTTSIEEHLHPAQKWYKSLTASNALRWAGANGTYVLKCAQRMIEQSITELQGCRRVMGILKLKDKYSQERVNVACRLALREDQCAYQRVKAILERGLDKVFTESESVQRELPLHDNIRGASAYA
jgi:transposase